MRDASTCPLRFSLETSIGDTEQFRAVRRSPPFRHCRSENPSAVKEPETLRFVDAYKRGTRRVNSAQGGCTAAPFGDDTNSGGNERYLAGHVAISHAPLSSYAARDKYQLVRVHGSLNTELTEWRTSESWAVDTDEYPPLLPFSRGDFVDGKRPC